MVITSIPAHTILIAHRERDRGIAFYLRLATSCKVLGTAEPATITANSTSLEAQALSVAGWRHTCDRYIRAMGEEESRPVSVARVAETPQ